jgi:hypothetical protein
MYEYKARRFLYKRAKGHKTTVFNEPNPMSRSEVMLTTFINNESHDGWELFFATTRYYFFKRKIK